MNNSIAIEHSDEYGVIVKIQGEDEADQLDDYLTENFYVHYDLREENGTTEFFFGQAASIDLVTEILSGFHID